MLKNTGERLILEDSWNLMTTLEHLHRYNAVEPLILGKTVLDAACGSGYGTFQLSKSAKQVYGIDISKDAVEYAKERYHNDNLEYNVMSIADITFDDETFDVITSFETIEHVTKDIQFTFLQQIKKKLKKDGILIMSTPNDQLLRDLSYGSYVNEFHLCEFTEREYIRFLEQYFKYVKIYYQTVTQVSAIVPKDNSIGKGSIYSMEKDNHMGRYYVAVCSDIPIENIPSMESTFLPVLEEYFDEAYFTKTSMLFVDRGNGFCDQDKIIGKYISRDGKQFKCHFSLDDFKNIKALRFDPCEHGGQIKITKVLTNKGTISLNPVNAAGKRNGFDEFHTLDPQYIIQEKNTLANINFITICGEIINAPDYEIITEYELNNQQLQREKQLSSELNAQIEILNSKATVREEENDKLIAGNNELLLKLSNKEEENSRLNSRTEELLQKLLNNEEENVKLVAHINELQSSVSDLEQKNNQILEQMSEQISSQYNEFTQTINDQTKQIEQLIEQNNHMQNYINEITNSKSWKITAPLRNLHGLFLK